MATHSSILTRIIPLTEEPGGLGSIGSCKSQACVTEHTHIHMKLAETEKLNKLCFFIWRFPFQGKPTVFRNFILIRKSELI